MRQTRFITVSCYRVTPLKRKKYLDWYLQFQLLKDFLENQFCMFQPFKGKQSLGVFKAVFKLAHYQLWLSMQIWAGSTKEILTSFPPSARFSTFSCARSVLRGCFVFEGSVHSHL